MKFAALFLFSFLLFPAEKVSLLEPVGPIEYAPLVTAARAEPLIRIGLDTSASSVSITTGDSQLVAVSPNEQPKFLETAKVTVSARAYRPPAVEFFNFEIMNIPTSAEAESIAKDVREIGEKAAVFPDEKMTGWRVRIGERKETLEEAAAYKDFLGDKGFEEAQVVTEKVTTPSPDAVALTQQLRTGAATSRVRSLTAEADPNKVKATVRTDIAPPAIDPNLREVIVNGASEPAKFSSLKPVAFGSTNDRLTPVRVNGKPYRGKIEVFVNDRGSLTVVNVVSMEDYLRGVVPNELSLPEIEAQKAQAIAARTYAWANINQFGKQGFDLLPTVRSQVYRGYSSESAMGTRAVQETAGVVATYKGKPINALYTSTCGGRTENSENIFEFAEPYLRGVECSLEGHRHFDSFMIRSARELPRVKNENDLELIRQAAMLSVNGFQMATPRFTDEWLEAPPTQSELMNWVGQIALRSGKPTPMVTADTAKPAELARVLAGLLYADAYADTLLSDSDVNYQLSFADGNDVPKEARANTAVLIRDGWLSLYSDQTLKPNKAMPRAKLLRLILNMYGKKKWTPAMQTGVTQPAADGKLVVKSGKTSKAIMLRPDVFLFRQFGDEFYQVKETALVGGETVSYLTGAAGEVTYLEIRPAVTTTVAERNSSFTLWNVNLSASAVQQRLSRYVRGIGTLIDVRIAQKGYSRRATDLEITGTNGVFHLKGGKIRSALKLNEQLFVMNKRYEGNRAVSYSFTGRGWGHGVGMCQYGAFGLAKMGLKYDQIVKHYYTGVDLTKTY